MKLCLGFCYWKNQKTVKNKNGGDTSSEIGEDTKGKQILQQEVHANLNAHQIQTRRPIEIKQRTSSEMGEQILQQKLPDDLIAHQILTKLPIKSVIRFKSVSKQWCSTLSSSQFAHLYGKLSPFSQPSPYTQFLIIKNGTNCYLYFHDDDVDYDDENITREICDNKKNLFKLRIGFDENLQLIGSCNGLVCLASCSPCFFILWNPITGRVQESRDHELENDSSRPYKVAWGFGYVPGDVDDYKVVRMLQLDNTRERIWVHVFSTKSNKWSRIVDKNYKDIFLLRSTVIERINFGDGETWERMPLSYDLMKGVLVHETIYWIVYSTNKSGRKVVCFDLVSEEFGTVADFELRTDFVYSDNFICELGGCLSKGGFNMRDDCSITILKCRGEHESIFLFRDLPFSSCEDLVGFTRSGQFFILNYSDIGLVERCSRPKKYVRLLKFEGRVKSCVTGYVPALTYPPPLTHSIVL